jgi:hypothetical protein
VVRGTAITADAVGIVFRRGITRSYDVYVCIEKTGRTRHLGSYDTDDFHGISGFFLVGKYLAFIASYCERGGTNCAGRPHVRNLATWKVREGSRTPRDAVDMAPVARSSGSMAWIRKRDDGGREVRALDAQGEHVLDSGAEIRPKSLAIANGVLYWLHGDQARTAPLQ